MAHDVLHMVCLGTHPCGSCRIIVPVYKTNLEFTPWSSKWQFLTLFSGCLKPSPCPLPIVVHSRSFFYFLKIKGRIFCPYFMSVWGPSSSPLPIMIYSSLFLISLWRLKEEFVLVFRVWSLFLPSTKRSFTLRSPTKHPVGAKNDRFKHPWKVNEKLANTYLHTRPFRGEKRTDNSSNDS